MITEKRFAESHHAFWRDLLPMGEHYIRTTNLELARFAEVLESTSNPRIRGVVNEMAFRLFAQAERSSTTIAELSEEAILGTLNDSHAFIRNFRQHGRAPLPTPGEQDIQEGVQLAKRTAVFFRKATASPLLVQPRFQGCGWLSECEGDVLSLSTLYEIKSGARSFRTLDVKQVLIYAALNFSAKTFDLQHVCLVNPREGTYFAESLNGLCELLAGRSAIEVLSDIVEYVSEASSRDDAG